MLKIYSLLAYYCIVIIRNFYFRLVVASGQKGHCQGRSDVLATDCTDQWCWFLKKIGVLSMPMSKACVGVFSKSGTFMLT